MRGLMSSLAFVLIGIVLSSCVCSSGLVSVRGVGAADSFPVHNVSTGLNYPSIQAAIEASATLDGHTILVDAGTYAEHVVVNKSLSIIGAGRDGTVIDGGNAGYVVHVVANDVLIRGFKLQRGVFGVFVDRADNFVMSDNNVTGIIENYAVYVYYSQNCTITGNVIGSNAASGILVTNSEGFTVSENRAVDNGYGINGYGINANASSSGVISWNDAIGNYYDGIGLGRGSTNCTVFGNNVTGNSVWGIWLDSDSYDNLIYDNDISKNGIQVSVNLANHWDNGFEGNYWSNYVGVDFDKNGIIDQPFVINGQNIDNYPLAGKFQSFVTPYDYRVNVISNSTIGGFSYLEPNGTIRFTPQENGTSLDYGFFRMSVPYGLTVAPFNVSVDDKNPIFVNDTLYDGGGKRWIYFDYLNFTSEISVQGVDKTIPKISIISPKDRTYDTSSVQLVFVVDDPPFWMAYSLDGQGNVTIDGNGTIEDVSNGTHYVTIYSRDFSGNIGKSNTVYFAANVPETPIVYWILIGIAIVVVTLVSVFVLRRRSKSKAKSGG